MYYSILDWFFALEPLWAGVAVMTSSILLISTVVGGLLGLLITYKWGPHVLFIAVSVFFLYGWYVALFQQ